MDLGTKKEMQMKGEEDKEEEGKDMKGKLVISRGFRTT